MPYPSFLYQHQGGPSNFHLAQRCGGDAENLPFTSLSSKFSRINHSCSNLQVDCDLSSRYDFWGLSADSPLASTITEDDFLEMVSVLVFSNLEIEVFLSYIF